MRDALLVAALVVAMLLPVVRLIASNELVEPDTDEDEPDPAED